MFLCGLAQTAIFGKHVDREFVQPVLILAKYLGDIGYGEGGCDGSQGQEGGPHRRNTAHLADDPVRRAADGIAETISASLDGKSSGTEIGLKSGVRSRVRR